MRDAAHKCIAGGFSGVTITVSQSQVAHFEFKRTTAFVRPNEVDLYVRTEMKIRPRSPRNVARDAIKFWYIVCS